MSAYDHARRYLEVQQWSGPILDRIAALEAERDRLREALSAVESCGAGGCCTCLEIVTEALEAGNG